MNVKLPIIVIVLSRLILDFFAIVDEISGCKKASSKILPVMNISSVPEAYAEYFVNKISVIRSNLVNSIPFGTLSVQIFKLYTAEC